MIGAREFPSVACPLEMSCCSPAAAKEKGQQEKMEEDFQDQFNLDCNGKSLLQEAPALK